MHAAQQKHTPQHPSIEHHPIPHENSFLLSSEALEWLCILHTRFADRIKALLHRRTLQQELFDRGVFPNFLPHTEHIRAKEWTVAPIPADLLDRRVEITGPPERKMVINALNSGASVFMADFEDSLSPTWSNVIQGQKNLYEAIRKTISYTDPSNGKNYQPNPVTATLMVRPRGWHLQEKHLHVHGEPIPASLFDFGLFFFHNAHTLLSQGSGPYFYLPKLESHEEAVLWNDVFVYAQQYMHVPYGSIKATVLIETLPAAFEMDEILHALKDHSAGLNCGRWDYIFSFIKTMRNHPTAVMPNRQDITMEQPCMRAYTQLLVRTCHRRKAHAMGGMAAHIPIKNNPEAHQAALYKVESDKLREVKDGHDGTWVAHPGLVPVARAVFDAHMPTPHQWHITRAEFHTTQEELLAIPKGKKTREGLHQNALIALQYLASWIQGQGCVPLNNLMEDAATAEISRTQLWQWTHWNTVLDTGEKISPEYISNVFQQALDALKQDTNPLYSHTSVEKAHTLLSKMVLSQTLDPFLTLQAYRCL